MSELPSLLLLYGLKEEDCNRQISDRDIDVLSRSSCTKWRSLPTYLGMPSIIASDIARGPGSEEEKRSAFFQKWKHTKGSAATYRVLIGALLHIQCRDDAERVCDLVHATLAASPSTGSSGTLAT